jgi:hypothetical protein
MHFHQIHSNSVLMSLQTNIVGFKPVYIGGTCSATRPFSFIMSSVPAAATSTFLAKNQMTKQTLVFLAQNK